MTVAIRKTGRWPGGPRRAVILLAGWLVVGAGTPPRDAFGQGTAPAQPRPRVGVALGGGSARGLAHVGVLRWLEEHHVPVDLVAGTSMGGLIGGTFAIGMSPDEIEALLGEIDWQAMFGSSNFRFMSVRRKRDARDYPSHLEFGLKKGLVAPPALNNGQQVDFLLARLTAPYYAIGSFDELPTPFRCVAVDLKTSRFVVLERGSLAQALRATMSLPLVFPPVALDDQWLVDGGVMNNVPADVVRGMGAARVVAVNVGDLEDSTEIATSLLGLMGSTLDAMMRASTRRAITGADVVINVPLKEYGSLDWRRYKELIAEGYRAAEANRAALLPLAVDEEAWQAWRTARSRARRTSLPVPAAVRVEGAAAADAELIRRALLPSVGKPFDPAVIEKQLSELGGLDRYEAFTWQLAGIDGADGVVVTARPKPYGPPFLFLAMSLENTTSNDFRFGLGGRYLAYDKFGSGSELRIDAAVGSDPSAAIALYRPAWGSPLFVEPYAGVKTTALNVVQDEHVIATYRQTRAGFGGDVGVNLGPVDDVRLGARLSHLTASSRVGDPGLPELSGKETDLVLRWTHDGQDSAILPTRGVHSESTINHIFDAPEPPPGSGITRSSTGVTRAETALSWVRSFGTGQRRRLFTSGGIGTTFDGRPLPTEQFVLGGPLRLGAYDVGERRGDRYLLANGGYLHQIARLPDLVGGAVMLGGWLEVGNAFDDWANPALTTQASAGLIADTLIGPVLAGFSVGADGASRFYLGIGRIFR